MKNEFKMMNSAEYFAVDAMSKSRLDQIAKSPAHLQEWLKNPPAPTPAMQLGSAFHCALLEPDRFPASYGELPDVNRTTKEGKAAYAAWLEENPGKIGLKADVMEQIRKMQGAFNAHSFIAKILKGAAIERCAFWQDEETSVACKARPDIVTPDGLVIDLKTTEDATAEAFSRDSWKHRYHVQAAMYLEGVSKALGRKHEAFLFIAVEKSPPYAITTYVADQEFLARGREAMRRDLMRYAECVRKNEWPAYSEEVQTLTLPRWAI